MILKKIEGGLFNGSLLGGFTLESLLGGLTLDLRDNFSQKKKTKNGKETQVNSFQRVLSYCSKEFAGRKVKSGKGGGGDFELSEIFKL